VHSRITSMMNMDPGSSRAGSSLQGPLIIQGSQQLTRVAALMHHDVVAPHWATCCRRKAGVMCRSTSLAGEARE